MSFNSSCKKLTRITIIHSKEFLTFIKFSKQLVFGYFCSAFAIQKYYVTVIIFFAHSKFKTDGETRLKFALRSNNDIFWKHKISIFRCCYRRSSLILLLPFRIEDYSQSDSH